MKIQLKLATIAIIAVALAFGACNRNSEDDPVTPVIHAIGDAYGGGKVAYILVSGDPGYDPAVQHGLIAATADQSSGISWALVANQGTTVPPPGASGTAIGTGLANTNAIVGQNGVGITYAAGLARAYNGGSYTDWYLPSKDELNKLYLNRGAIGGFAADYYWSSSEYNASFAQLQNFNNGSQLDTNKSSTIYVRAVRSF